MYFFAALEVLSVIQVQCSTVKVVSVMVSYTYNYTDRMGV